MATSASRVQTIVFSGDVVGTETQTAATSANSPAQIQKVTLAIGANTLSVPPTAPTALTIVPPPGNTNLITLKGIAGDTGVPLHKTDPTTVALDSAFTSLVLNAAAQIVGVLLVWS